ncbi:MAG: D-alanyl-D-alanine carboxypeptidase family protein [Muricoprocola sp.]
MIWLGADAAVWSAKEEPAELQNLYAQSAVLMDGRSGRILFGKNETEFKPMASTTKIMTCIVALENSDLDEIVTVSANAQSQPEVHLGVTKGERFYLRDILYSLMLESHNDSAVMVAEQVGGSVEQFADMMNEKAREIGCSNTHFVTPNGLDAEDEDGAHGTTARDLARIMSYCILESPKKEEFLEITGKKKYEFQDADQKRNFTCYNHNTFLDMMPGALSGKTGFTSQAGYCYVGALESRGRVFVVALLACGWPFNRNYKWEDTRKLMQYGMDHYELASIYYDTEEYQILVNRAVPSDGDLTGDVYLCAKEQEHEEKSMLIKKEEEIKRIVILNNALEAPVEKGEVAGEVSYVLGDEVIAKYPVLTENMAEKITWKHWAVYLLKRYFTVQRKQLANMQ